MNILTPGRRLRRLGLIAAVMSAFGAFTASPALAHSPLIAAESGKDSGSGGLLWVLIAVGLLIGIGIGIGIVYRAQRTYRASGRE